MPSELRQDATSGEWVILSKDRGNRPRYHAPPRFSTHQSQGREQCPFCPAHEAETPTATFVLSKKEKWQVRVFPNKFPALSPEETLSLPESGLFPNLAGHGFHEVIVETPEHDGDIAWLTENEMQLVLEAYRNRHREWSRKPGMRTIVIFRNQGPRSGATIPHPHSQLLALPIVPASFAQRFQIAALYWNQHGRNLYQEILREEKDRGERVITESEHFLAFTPYAPRSSFETWIFPKQASPCFASLAQEELADLARTLQNVLRRLEKALSRPDYNYVIYSAPDADEKHPGFSWHMKIFPRLFSFAGFEIGSGMAILTVTPEQAARSLREIF